MPPNGSTLRNNPPRVTDRPPFLMGLSLVEGRTGREEPQALIHLCINIIPGPATRPRGPSTNIIPHLIQPSEEEERNSYLSSAATVDYCNITILLGGSDPFQVTALIPRYNKGHWEPGEGERICYNYTVISFLHSSPPPLAHERSIGKLKRLSVIQRDRCPPTLVLLF